MWLNRTRETDHRPGTVSAATAASTRIWRRLGAVAREALLRGLPAPELRTILADVARVRAAELEDADLIDRWRRDPFLTPSPIDPRASLRVQTALWERLPAEFTGVELSPLTSLGSVSRLSGIGQNRVVSALRGGEVVFDPVHPLALEASRLRRSGHSRVHLASCVRIAQAWDSGERQRHEQRWGLISSAPDGGGFSTEADLLNLQVDFWRDAVGAVLPGGRVEIAATDPALAEHLAEQGTCDGVIVHPTRDAGAWRHPYVGGAFRIVTAEGDVLGDGGIVQWTQALTRNRKDRCVVSSISVDGVVAALAH